MSNSKKIEDCFNPLACNKFIGKEIVMKNNDKKAVIKNVIGHTSNQKPIFEVVAANNTHYLCTYDDLMVV